MVDQSKLLGQSANEKRVIAEVWKTVVKKSTEGRGARTGGQILLIQAGVASVIAEIPETEKYRNGKTQKSGHKVFVLFGAVFVEEFVDGPAENGEFLLGEILDDLHRFISLCFRQSFSHQAVNEVLHLKKFGVFKSLNAVF